MSVASPLAGLLIPQSMILSLLWDPWATVLPLLAGSQNPTP